MSELQDTYATRLAKKITESERTYRHMSADCWAAYDVVGAVRWRAMADGLELAREHQLTVAQETPVARSLRDRAADPAVVAAVATRLVGLLDRGAAQPQAASIIAVVLDELAVKP